MKQQKNNGTLALEARNQAIKDMKNELKHKYIPCGTTKSRRNFLLFLASTAITMTNL